MRPPNVAEGQKKVAEQNRTITELGATVEILTTRAKEQQARPTLL
jgi:hypothetical protein